MAEIPQISFKLEAVKLAKLANQMLNGPYRGNEIFHGVSEGADVIRSIGDQSAKLNINSAKLPPKPNHAVAVPSRSDRGALYPLIGG